MVRHFIEYHPGSRNNARLVILFLSITFCCLVTLYSSLVLNTTTVYSHLFYIPVMLASLWWHRKGFPVVLFLSLLLLLSYRVILHGSVAMADYFRVLVFFSVGIVIVLLPGSKGILTLESVTGTVRRIRKTLENETLRLVIITFLIIISCLLTVYFHNVRNSGTVFTHFFYIPIILSALWWGINGLWVAFFLAFFLIYGHLFLRDYTTTINDYFRATMFIVVPLVISLLEDRLESAEKRIEYLDFASNLVSSITRLVVEEIDVKKLAGGIVSAIAKSSGCSVAVFSFQESLKSAGLPDEKIIKFHETGAWPPAGVDDLRLFCHENFLAGGEHRITYCERCINRHRCPAPGRIAVTDNVSYNNTGFGILTSVFSESIKHNTGLVSLLKTVADELAYALYNLDMAIRKKKTEEQLYYDELRAKTILELGHMTDSSFTDICMYALEETVKITKSECGYLAIPEDDGSTFTIISMSMAYRETGIFSSMPGGCGSISPVFYSKLPRITRSSSQLEKLNGQYCINGLVLKRQLDVPVIVSGEAVAVIGVGNRETDYNCVDINNISLLMQGMWTILKEKKTAGELERYREKLEEMVWSRTEELEDANRKLVTEIRERRALYSELEKSASELENFVHTVTHDLRSPLSIIGLCTQSIGKIYTDRFDEKGLKLLDLILKNTVRMEELIRDVLTLSRIGMEQNTGESIDTSEVLNDISERMSLLFKEKYIRFIIRDGMPVIIGNRSLIMQVFENLITNAVKYMGDCEFPVIEAGCESTGTGFYRFYIRDNGIGIDPEYYEKIFEEFYRVHNINVEGNGIGLAIVRKVVEKHGGNIYVESGPGKGSTFFFTLPGNSE